MSLRGIKRIAARKPCSIAETVYGYSIILKDDAAPTSTTSNKILRYKVWLKGIVAMLSSESEIRHWYMGENALKPVHIEEGH